MEAFGRGLVVEPFIPTVLLAGGVLKRSANAEQRERWIAPLISGDVQAALAVAEPQGRFDPCDVATTARPSDNGYVINGRKAVVLNGGIADLLIIPARTSKQQRDERGITLFALEAGTAGVVRRPYKTVDGHRAAEIVLENVRVPSDAVLGAVDDGAPTLLDTIDDAVLAVCAEAFGIVRALQEKTVEYTKNRVQFGVPIASFQALQHRMVDMLIAREQLRSLLTWTAMLAASGAPDKRRAVSALKYHVGTAGRRVGQEAVQLHGGMGVSWELDIAHYFKRLSAIEIVFGNADYHLDRFRRLSSPP